MSGFRVPNEHELWLKTNGKEGIRLVLTGHDLNDDDLSETTIIDAVFDGIKIVNVDFTYSNIRYTSFTGACLNKVRIIKAEADHTVFEDANICNCNMFRTSFIQTNFKKAVLTENNFSYSILINADFSNAVINKCRFFNASLSGANLLNVEIPEWIDIGENGQPKLLYGIKAFQWLKNEAGKE